MYCETENIRIEYELYAIIDIDVLTESETDENEQKAISITWDDTWIT
jgi:hypothetical protein